MPLTGAHVPAEPSSAHASHSPVHAALQQTPSAQKPSAHSAPREQLVAIGFFVAHFPFKQKPVFVAQSASAAQLVLQAAAPHAYGAQSTRFVSQVPSPSHTEPLTAPFEQAVAPQAVPAFA